jgi:putative oxidoreductase
MSDAAGLVVLVGRILFAVYFGFVAGYQFHVKQGAAAAGYAKQMNMPAPALGGWPTGAWLIAAAISIGFGIWPDVGALMIIVFLVIAAWFFHRFWEIEDQMQRLTASLLFWRNFFTVGACLMLFGTFVALGPALRFAVTSALFDF